MALLRKGERLKWARRLGSEKAGRPAGLKARMPLVLQPPSFLAS